MEARQWVVSRASGGTYSPDCFRLDRRPVPATGKGEILVRTRLLSLDPTHLNWVKLDPSLQFLPIGIGDPMIGTNLGDVIESAHPDFSPGQVVIGTWGWAETALADAAYVRHALPANEMSFEDQLIVTSHIGQAAGGGMFHIGKVKSTDAVLVSGAAGATGSIAAQIAKAAGCFTVGIAGGDAKCRYLIEELGLDGAIDYRAGGLDASIERHFPQGVDLFFDNVGGEILDIVLGRMAPGCRVVICGAIAQYDAGHMGSFDGIKRLPMLIFRQARMEGFVAGQFGTAANAEIIDRLIRLYGEGQLRVRAHVVPFDEMPHSLGLLLTGSNEGKLIARVN